MNFSAEKMANTGKEIDESLGCCSYCRSLVTPK